MEQQLAVAAPSLYKDCLQLVTLLANTDRDNKTYFLRGMPKDVLWHIARIMHLYDNPRSFLELPTQTLTVQLWLIEWHEAEIAIQCIRDPSDFILRHMIWTIQRFMDNGADYGDEKPLQHFPKKLVWEYIQRDPGLIQLVPNPPEKWQVYVVRQSPSYILWIPPGHVTPFVKNLFVSLYHNGVECDAIWDMAIPLWEQLRIDRYQFSHKQWYMIMQRDIIVEWEFFKDVPHQFKAHLEETAVRTNLRAVQWCRNPLVQLWAIQQDWHIIELIQNPCEEAQMAAVMQDLKAIDLIQNPHENVRRYVGISPGKKSRTGDY